MICGIIGSGSSHLPAVAAKAPADKGAGLKSKLESRVKSYGRWIQNEAIDAETFFLPFAENLIQSLAHLPLYLSIDGSVVGRDCMVLMIGLVYKKRALPLVWTVHKKEKGHFTEEIHLEVLRQVEKLVHDHPQVILLGDGEFDGIRLQSLISEWGWKYVLRTGRNIKLHWEGMEFSFDEAIEYAQPEDCFELHGALFTNEQYGPVMPIIWWRKDCKEPICLVTNMADGQDACRASWERFSIETFFSDQKSRGFDLGRSHLSNPQRIARLMIAACIAYHWIVYLGAYALQSGLNKVVHRTKRCDLSLFKLGLRLLDYLIGEDMPIPAKLTLPQEGWEDD